jgi:hypothetical protein
MEAIDAELQAIGLTHDETMEGRDTLQKHGVKTLECFSDSQSPSLQAAHLKPEPGH